jgi:hypothetical protein
MKKPVLLVGLLVFAITAMAQTDYLQWEVISMKPKADKLDLFKKSVAAHNKKYHAVDPYKVGVSAVLTGPNTGEYTWIMGPCTWTQLDSRPGKGEHDIDWDKTVVPNIEYTGDVSYWRADKDLQYTPANSNPASFTKSRLRFFTLLPGQGDRFVDLFKKVVEVYKKKGYAASYAVYWRVGASTGPHIAVSLNFDKWAYFDKATTFVKDFNEIHGDYNYERFLDDLALCVDNKKTYDELNEYLPELSGGN